MSQSPSTSSHRSASVGADILVCRGGTFPFPRSFPPICPSADSSRRMPSGALVNTAVLQSIISTQPAFCPCVLASLRDAIPSRHGVLAFVQSRSSCPLVRLRGHSPSASRLIRHSGFMIRTPAAGRASRPIKAKFPQTSLDSRSYYVILYYGITCGPLRPAAGSLKIEYVPPRDVRKCPELFRFHSTGYRAQLLLPCILGDRGNMLGSGFPRTSSPACNTLQRFAADKKTHGSRP